MKSLITKIIGACLGLSLATGVGVGIAAGQREVKEANAATETLTIQTSDFTTKSYADNNKQHTTGNITWYSNQIMQYASAMQWKKNEGYIYNVTSLGTIKSVNITSTEGTFTTKYGASSNDGCTSSTVGGGFFKISVGNATGKTSKIVVTYEQGGSVPTLSGITIGGSMTKTSYTTNDSSWNPAGLTVSASYTSGSPSDVTSQVTWSYDPATPSSTSTTSVAVTASYTEGGVTKTATKNVAVTVSEPAPTGEFSKFTGELEEGDYVIYYGNGGMKASVTSNRFDFASMTPSNNKITNPVESAIWHIAPDGDYWTIYNESTSLYAASTGTKSQGALEETVSDKSRWTASGTSTYEFVNKYNADNEVNANLRKNGNYGFACYNPETGGALTLYKLAAEKAIVDQKVSGSVSASNYSTEWDTTNLKFEIKYEGDTNFTNVTNQATFTVNASIPEITETTTTQVSVTGTYNKDTSITDTRNVTAYLNFVELEDTTIERLYFETLGDRNGHYFYGQYMGYAARTRGTTTYYDLYIGNGDYAILVYGAMTEEPTFTPFETYLKISNGYLGNFSNLYEVIDYDSSTQTDYNVVVEELTDETETARVAPVTTYNMTGLENGSLPEYQRTASRLAAVGGVVKSISGTISSTTTATVTITLDNGNDVSVYINKSTASLDYDNLASKIVVNNRVAIKGFTSIHDSTYQMVLPFAIEIPNPYTAETFAQDLINATAAICAVQQDGNAKALSKVWATLQTEKFVCLTLAEKNILKNSAAVENGTTIEDAMARYDLICVKYRLTNFIERSSAVPASNLINFFGLDSSNGAVASVVIVLTLVMSSAAAFFILKKKKHN